MKMQLYCLLLSLPWSLVSMEMNKANSAKNIKHDFEQSEVVINMDDLDERQNDSPFFLDNHDLVNNPLELYNLNVLRNTPCFAGRRDKDILQAMKDIETMSPREFGSINQLINQGYTKGKKPLTINPDKLKTLSEKILYALYQTNREALEEVRKNREADGRIGKWRWIGGLSLSFVLGVPATTLAIISLVKTYV